MTHQSRFLLLASLFFFIGGTLFSAWGQSNFFKEDVFQFETGSATGFSEDGRVKVLLLTLMPTDMSETAATEIAKALQLNLFNTNHFTVVGPSEWNAQIQERDPSLADCHDIACGILVGKLFNADKVLVGSIKVGTMLDANGMEQQGMLLSVKVVDVVTNIADFVDEIQFTDNQMHSELFQLAIRISQNTLLRGHVLTVGKVGALIALGRAHGLKIGDHLVIYRQDSTTTDIKGRTLELSSRNLAVAQVTRVKDMSAEAVIIQKSGIPVQKGDFAKTYVNLSKQINLISKTRRELDTQKRLAPRIRRPLKLTPQLQISNTGKDQWRQQLFFAKQRENRWMYIAMGTGAATLLVLNGNLDFLLQGSLLDIAPWAAGGAFIYSGFQYLKFKNLAGQITAGGRVQGFSSRCGVLGIESSSNDSALCWGITPKQTLLSYRSSF